MAGVRMCLRLCDGFCDCVLLFCDGFDGFGNGFDGFGDGFYGFVMVLLG